ncbi:MAG: hypothetical protein GXY90_11960 [Peptococcaceae bacterium]|nr:hypothetical protein [Peptococcaceae bacterium]
MAVEGICDGDMVFIRRQSHVDFYGQISCALIHGKENSLYKLLGIRAAKSIYVSQTRYYLQIFL